MPVALLGDLKLLGQSMRLDVWASAFGACSTQYVIPFPTWGSSVPALSPQWVEGLFVLQHSCPVHAAAQTSLPLPSSVPVGFMRDLTDTKHDSSPIFWQCEPKLP